MGFLFYYLAKKQKKTKMTDTAPTTAQTPDAQAQAPEQVPEKVPENATENASEKPSEKPSEQVPAQAASQENEGASPANFSQACKSLYVADLAPNVTESTLLEVFSRVGPNAVQSIRVCRDSTTGASLGYAYVNFHRPEDCERALDLLNFEEINGRACRISKSNRDPRLRRSGVGNLFVKNIAKDIDHAGLHDVFATFGEIMSCKIAIDRATGESKGYGFVHFSNPEDADTAIDNLNGKCLNDKQIYVGKFIPRQNRQNSGSGKTFTNIYLKNLNKSLSEEKFKELLTKATSDIGKITSPKLMVSNENGEEVSKGFGFVNFETHEAAAAALERFKDPSKMAELAPELTAEGETLYANVAMSKTERKQAMDSEDRNLFVKNIADSITEEKFKEIFEEKQFGTITSAVIMKDDNGNKKGFGFVCYETKEAASAAKQAMNGQNVGGKPLYVALAQPKEQRRRQLQMHYSRTPMGHGVPPVGYPGVPGMAGYFVGGMPAAARYQQPRGGPGPFRGGRMQVPGFAGGRGGPRAFPMAHPGQPQNPDFLSDFFKGFNDSDASQRLGDMLYEKLISEDKLTEFDAKRVVGSFLRDSRGKPMQQTVEQVRHYHFNGPARKNLIGKVLHGEQQQS